MSKKDAPTLLSYQETRITAEPSALFMPLFLFGVGLVTSPNSAWFARLRRGIFMIVGYETATIVHVLGHIHSSRYAKAPMDQFHLAAPMPRTMYYNDDVSPQAHRLRAVGGPIASILDLLLTLLLRPLTPRHSAIRELFNIKSVFHALIGFGSLMPMPFVDGGPILKWTLVEQGRSPEEADGLVNQTNLAIGGLVGVIGLVLALRRQWKWALLALFNAVQFIGVGLGKLKL